MHGRKRRIVSQGFSAAAIAASEPMILSHVRNLCKALLHSVEDSRSSLSNKGCDGWSLPEDMGLWSMIIFFHDKPDVTDSTPANYLTLDVISDLTYGRAFNLLTDASLRWVVEAIVSGNRLIYLRFAFPALFNVKPSAWYSPYKWIFPEMADERRRFVEISTKFSEERNASQEMKDRKDIMSALLEARDSRTGTKLSNAEVWGEAHLMIAAGKLKLFKFSCPD